MLDVFVYVKPLEWHTAYVSVNKQYVKRLRLILSGRKLLVT